jgi:succinate dehydrogenase/fumarate reductase-like Fe-S protein
MIVEIQKSEGSRRYEVPGSGQPCTVMQILDYISRYLDHSLAYFRHSACGQGICGRCAVRVNGKNALSCTAIVEPDTERLVLEPAGNNIVRDLVIRAVS